MNKPLEQGVEKDMSSKTHKHDIDIMQMEVSPLYYTGQSIWTLMRWTFMICMVFLIMYPLLYMLSMSIRSPQDFYDITVIWLPKSPTLQHFKTAIFNINLLDALKNTVFIATGSTILQIFITCMVGYGFARFRFKGNSILFTFVVLSIVVPSQMLSMPNYILFKNLDFFGLFRLITGRQSSLNLLDTIWSYYLPAVLGQGMRSGIFILVFRQFFSGLPMELEEAALIDGCGYKKTFFQIMLPNAVTPIVVYSLFSLVWYWGDYFTAFINLSKMKTMAMMLVDLRQTLEYILPREKYFIFYTIPIQQAAGLVSILPLIAIFIIGQRYFVQGIDKTGIVG